MKTRSTLTLLAVAVLLVMIAPPATATAVSARIDSVIAIGGQLHAVGQLTVRSVGRGNLLALIADGRQVALLYRSDSGWRTPGSEPVFLFQRDAGGILHFSGLGFRSNDGQSTREVNVTVAAVAPGLGTVDPRLPRETTHRAAR